MNYLNQNVSITCSKHGDQLAQFIQINQLDKESQIFYCDLCLMSDKTIKLQNFMLLNQIINHSENQLLEEWPPLDDTSLIQSIIQNLNDQKKQPISEVILKFFSDLKVQIANKIDQVQKRVLNNHHVLMQYYQQDEIEQKVIEIQRIEDFQKILKNIVGQKEKEQLCYDYLSNLNLKKSENTTKLKEQLEKINYYKLLRDFYQSDKQSESILTIIDQLEFFNLEKSLKQSQTWNIILKDLKNYKLDLLPDFSFIKSKYKEEFSEYFVQRKLENNMVQIISSQENIEGFYYSNIEFERNLKYIFRFQLENCLSFNSILHIGFFKDQKKYQNYEKDICIDHCYKIFPPKNEVPQNGIQKDKDISFQILNKSLELRVYLNNEQFDLLEYPKQSFKLCIPNNYKSFMKSKKKFRLGILLKHKIGLRLTYACICDQFED